MNQNTKHTPAKSTNQAILLENLVHPDNKLRQLKGMINWRYLNKKLGHLFDYKNAPSPQLILGLLYLQSINNLPYSEVIPMWKNSPEWQYFCGEEFFSESYPLHNASLQIWSRTVGEKGRTFMTNALVNGFIQEKRLTKPDNTKENLKTYFRSFPAQQEHRESSNISAI